MTINEQDKHQLIKYRLEQANDTVGIAELLLKNQKYAAAVNRIYYGIFYSLLALGLKFNFETSKHLQLIGWFNKGFVKTNKIEIEFGKILRKAYEARTSGDYDAFYEFDPEDVLNLFNEMKKFINRIEDLIKDN